METEHATPELFASLLTAQSEIENATKNANNPFHKSKYADLNEVLGVIKPVFVKHKLGFMQFPGFDGQIASVTTLIHNDKGAFLSFTSGCVPVKSDAQNVGAATTYLRRYSLAGLVGIYQEDDDGNSQRHDRKPPPVQKPVNKPANNPAAKANPHKAAIDKLMAGLIKGAVDLGVVADDAAGVSWFNKLAADTAAKSGKRTADMTNDEFEQFEQAMVTYAADAAMLLNTDKDVDPDA